jgi:hypothetical protein
MPGSELSIDLVDLCLQLPIFRCLDGEQLSRQDGQAFIGFNAIEQRDQVRHMWTAPSSQGVWQRFDQIACVHMSGLSMRSHMNAGQDGFRDTGSKQQGDL